MRIRKKWLCVSAAVCLFGVCACQNSSAPEKRTEEIRSETEKADEAADEKEYESRLLSLGNYKGLTYTDESGREPTDAQVEEEMMSLLDWFEDGELTEEFVRENLEFDSIEEFREDTRKNLKEVYAQQAYSDAAMELFAQVTADSEFEMVQSDVDRKADSFFSVHRQEAQDMGISFADYLKQYFGVEEQQFEETVRRTAEQLVKTALTAEAVAEAEQLSVDDFYDRIAGDLAKEDGFDSVAEMEEASGGRAQVEKDVLYRMAADVMMKYGTPQESETESVQP